ESSSCCSSTARRAKALTAALLPRVEQAFDVPSLRVGEGHTGKQPPHLGRIVVLHRCLEMLPPVDWLLQLAAQPAPETDLGGPVHSGSLTASVSPSTATDPPSARMTITATAAPRSRSSCPRTTGPEEGVTGEIASVAPSTRNSIC